MEFFTRFKWAVPTAFADTLSVCRFVEGDVVHDHQDAYSRGIYGKTLQVKYPTYGSPSAATSHASEESALEAPRSAGGGLFESNWRSEVRVVLYDRLSPIGASGSVGQMRTTQGRLYTALWKGDLDVLREEHDHPDPPMPIRLVTKRLARTQTVAAAVANDLSCARDARQAESQSPVFVMVQDAANPTSRDKYRRVSQALASYLSADPKALDPQAAGLVGWDRIAPTTHIAFFVLDPSLTREEIVEIVKGAVYAGNAGKFRLEAHGMVFDGTE